MGTPQILGQLPVVAASKPPSSRGNWPKREGVFIVRCVAVCATGAGIMNSRDFQSDAFGRYEAA